MTSPHNISNRTVILTSTSAATATDMTAAVATSTEITAAIVFLLLLILILLLLLLILLLLGSEARMQCTSYLMVIVTPHDSVIVLSLKLSSSICFIEMLRYCLNTYLQLKVFFLQCLR